MTLAPRPSHVPSGQPMCGRDAQGAPTVSPRDQLAAALASVKPQDAPTHKLGVELCNADRIKALRAYVHRYTRDHKPNWAHGRKKDGLIYEVQFASDREWLDTTEFPVNKRGRLIDGPCISHPTWPDRNKRTII